MENDMESEKLSVIIFGQKFCSKLEHIPIKKRILLRDSAIYQCTPPSVDYLNQEIDSPPVTQNSNHPPPFLGQYSDLNSFSKQQADNLKSLQFNDNCRKTVAVNMEDYPLFSGIRTPVDIIVNNAGKDRRADTVSPCTKGELRHVSPCAPVAKGDGLIAKSLGAALSLIGNVTEDSYFGEKLALQPDHVSCKNGDVVQLITQDNRILWDLNVEMDAWETPDNLLNAESKSDTTTSDLQNDSNLELEISEEYRLKREITMSESYTENNVHPMLESTYSDGIDKDEQITSDSADGERYGFIKEGQQVATGSCLGVACSIAKPSREIASMNLCCNHGLSSETDNCVNLKLGENTTNLFDYVPRRDPGTICANPDNSVISTEEHNCDSKNVIIEGEGSVNILHISDNEDNNLSKKGTDSKTGQHDGISCSSADQLEQIATAKESDVFATPEEKIIGEAIKAAPSTRELIETPPEHVDIDMGNPLLGSFLEGCDTPVMQSVSMSATRLQGATIVKLIPGLDKECRAQIEQDYEDGELREVDTHCWNEDETKIGKIECLDCEPGIEDIDNLDESHTSVSVGKGERGHKSRKSKLSETLVKDNLLRMDDVNMGLNDSGYGPHIVNTQLEKKLSGWDQLPKERRSSSEKVQETQGMLSRTLRSELHSRSDMPALSEDAEDKETVVERRIRPKYMDVSYPADGGSGFDKFNGKRRSTPHMHGRNRVEDRDSERRSSVNYHDLYDNHSGSRLMNINSKEREQFRSRSPYDRNRGHGPHNSCSRGGNGSRAEEFGRSLRGARNVYRGSLTYDRSESEFRIRPQFGRRDRSFSPKPASHFSETLIRSRSRSRTRSPPLWVPPYERLGPRVHRRSPEFSINDRVKRTTLQFWKSNYLPDNELRYNSPSRSGYLRQNKPGWNDEEDFDLRVSRNRSPVRSFDHKENFDASCSQGSFKSSEDFRRTGYCGRRQELTPPDRVSGYNGGKDKRKQGDSFEADQRKRYYKDSFMR